MDKHSNRDYEANANTLRAVSHASLSGLQIVEKEVATVANRDGDAEEAAVFGAAMKELPGGTGRQLEHLARPR